MSAPEEQPESDGPELEEQDLEQPGLDQPGLEQDEEPPAPPADPVSTAQIAVILVVGVLGFALAIAGTLWAKRLFTVTIPSKLGYGTAVVEKDDEAPASAEEAPGPNEIAKAQLQSAVQRYMDDRYEWPRGLDLIVGQYVPAIPQLNVSPHKPTNEVEEYGGDVCDGPNAVDPSRVRDTGRWGYVADRKAKCYGVVFIDCTHRDARGRVPAAL